MQTSFIHPTQQDENWNMKNKFKNSLKYPLIIALLLNSHCVLAGEILVGLAVVNSHSAIQGKNNDTELDPAIIYQGENFSFINGSLAYRFFTSDSLSIAVTGQQREEKYEPKDSQALNGMDKRDSAFDMGINIQSNKSWGTLELAVLGDVSSTYDGSEVRASYAYPWIKGRWILTPAVGVSYLSQELVGYYYGVKNSEQNVDRPAYRGEAGVNSFVEISIIHQLSAKWTFIAGMDYVYLDEAIKKSPIVDENHEATAFTAIAYSF